MPKNYTSTKPFFGGGSLYTPGEVFELADGIKPSKCMTEVASVKEKPTKGKKSSENTLLELTKLTADQMKVKGGDGTENV
jgi:hypothetical protein